VGKTIVDVVRDLGRSGRLRAALALPDEQLLDLFVRLRDETAFEALLHRHGPLVFGVCRKLLYNVHDAEDAFQATFLILARKASSVAPRSLVGHWLYGVACRVAARARKIALRRSREQSGADLADAPAAAEKADTDLAVLLHEEVQRLPDKYRRPVVLCHLEGKTNEEAAHQLQWPVGTVKGRLNRARAMLHARLTRRGVALSVGLLTTALVPASSALPAGLVEVTAKAGLCFVAGNAAAGGLASAQAVALTKGVLYTMLLSKLKSVAALVLSVAVLVGAGSVAFRALAVETSKADEKDKKADKAKEDKDAILGTWKVVEVEVDGKDGSDTEKGREHKAATLTITAEKITAKSGEKSVELTYKLDPTAKPKTIDLDNGGGKSWMSVYSLDGNTLKICSPQEPGGNRPTAVGTKEGSRSFMLVLKREAKDKDK
jgi:RNA polymerase sigma factor (sigma-70 family)